MPGLVVTTADGHEVTIGDRVFSHYSMREGYIRESIGFDGWFDLVYEDGSRDYLNGERICSLAHAKRMGWLSD